MKSATVESASYTDIFVVVEFIEVLDGFPV